MARAGLLRYASVILTGAAVLFAAFPWVIEQRQQSVALSGSVDAARQVASSYRAQVEARVAGLLATAEVLRAIGPLSAQGFASLEARLPELFPDAKRIRLLRTGHNSIDNDPDAPLGYADLEQLRAAEKGEPVPLEMLQAGTPLAHANVVIRLAAEAGGDRLLVASLSPTRIEELLGSVPGHASLIQRAAGRELVVAKRGNAAQAVAPLAIRAAIPGTRWELLVRNAPPTASPGSVEWALQLYAVLAALFGLVLAGVFYWLNRTLRHDQVATLSLVGELFAGRGPGNLPPRLRSFANMHRLIIAMRGTEMKPAAVATAPRSVAKPAPSPDPESEPPAEVTPQPESPVPIVTAAAMPVPDASIFRACDIRGVVGQTLTVDAVRAIGQSIGSAALDHGQESVAVGRDGRISGPELSEALIEGLQVAGTEVVDIGMVPTPVLYFAAQMDDLGAGVMITGSHNPPDYNGLKVVIGSEALHGDAIQQLRARIENGGLRSGAGSKRSESVTAQYIQRISDHITLDHPLKVVIDCGNGVAGAVAPDLYRALGCEVVELYCEVDGHFPNHHPDPGQPENLVELRHAVQQHQADLGLAFDGDGDRLGVIDNYGELIWPDRVMMLFARDLLIRQPGAEILYDVKCSRNLPRVIEQAGGRPTMWKTGHSLIKAKMRESGAPLACEMSGHFFFSERWYGFDDALYAGARLLELLSLQSGMSSNEMFAILPDSVVTPELMVAVPEGTQHGLIARLTLAASFPDATTSTIDGLRVDFDNGFGLVRASNTTPNLVLRFEGIDEESLETIQQRFRALLQTQLPDAQLPF